MPTIDKMADKAPLIEAREAFLARHGLSIPVFADRTKTDYHTALPWFKQGRRPRKKYLDAVLEVYPDFPINVLA